MAHGAIGLALLASSCFVGIDLSLLDGGPGADRGADGAIAGGCPSDQVEVPIAGGTCVDRTEVTRRAYALFVAELPGGGGPAGACRGNNSSIPEQDWPPGAGTEDRPVAWVDWCDAAAYCSWRGKRLCGAIGGGASQVAAVADPALGEWAAACTGGGATRFPYGDTFQGGRCRGSSSEPAAAGVLPGCEGGFPGLFDLSGNLAEWQDACDSGPMPGPNDDCAILGGGFGDQGDALACAARTVDRRSRGAQDRGFRCCSSP